MECVGSHLCLFRDGHRLVLVLILLLCIMQGHVYGRSRFFVLILVQVVILFLWLFYWLKVRFCRFLIDLTTVDPRFHVQGATFDAPHSAILDVVFAVLGLSSALCHAIQFYL